MRFRPKDMTPASANCWKGFASNQHPLFSVGSSGIENAMASQFNPRSSRRQEAHSKKIHGHGQILIGSGSCSPVTSGQIVWALKHGFAEVPVNAGALATMKTAAAEIKRAAAAAAKRLQAGCSVIVHTTKAGSNKRIAARFKKHTAQVLGTALGEVMRETIKLSAVRRICIAGGDTSSYAALALGIEALEMIAPLTPGAPLCRIHAPGSPADGREIIFKGGQVGAEDYFQTVLKGNL